MKRRSHVALFAFSVIFVAAILLPAASLTGDYPSRWPLCGALGAGIAVNVLELIRRRSNRKGSANHEGGETN